MDAKFNIAINWYLTQQARGITYSMTSRLGPNSYDCSSAGYIALKTAGLLPANIAIGNTDSMFRDFEKNGWVQLKPNAQGNYDTKKGDAAIWGKRGASGGANGHFMFFVDADRVINCRVAGIKTDNYDSLRAANGYPEQTFYRYVGTSAAPAPNPVDQDVDVGSYIKFASALTVTKVELQGGIWQVLSNDLCATDPTWDDNGVPAEPLVEVDDQGYQTADQDLNPGSKFILPGKYEVLDLGQSGSMWLALIQWNGLKFWVDIAKATEVAATDPGTPTPGKRPVSTPTPTPAPSTPAPTPTPTTEQPAVETPVTETPAPGAPKQTDEPETTTPVTNPAPSEPVKETQPAKEPTKMAFTKEQQDELMVNSQKLVDQGAAIAASDEGQKIIGKISDKTKMTVYFIGDTLLGLGALTPQVAIIILSPDPVAKVGAISSAFATAGLYVLTMFGIYKSGK